MFDAYTRKARLAPALLASLPAIGLLLAGAMSPSTSASPIVITAGAIGVLICGAVRDRGRAIQTTLWARWGGEPTIRRLRWSDSDDVEATALQHQRLEETLGMSLPSQADELADADRADRKYRDAITELRERTRGEGFELVLAENAEYGFRRNTLGLRTVAIGIAAAALAISAALVIASGQPRFFACAAWALFIGVVWHQRVSSTWVREAGEIYADRLLDASRRTR